MKMQTLAQMRNNVLKKLNKKRKLGFTSLGSADSRLAKQVDKKIKTESKKEKLYKKDSCKEFLTYYRRKQKREGCQDEQSLCSSSKRKRGSEGLQTESIKRRRNQKKKKKKDKVVPEETARLQRRVKYLLVKMKLEQNLIDAYLGEGWKGQSREKIKPEKELQRAKNQILKCKLGIRDTVHQLDLLSSDGQIDLTRIEPDGSVHHEYIFCKKCKTQDVSEDNDIILCDGTCNCAFHQKCIDPPLATKDVPPEDEGWFCKYCNCKMEILEAMNAHLGTQFSAYSTWQDVFKEEARLSIGGTIVCNPEEEWPDDESDDDDYDPNREENDVSNRCIMEDSDVHEETSTSSSCCSLESEVLSESGFFGGRHGVSSNGFLLDQNCVSEANDNEITSGPRKRCVVDYRKLYDEMFGKETTTTGDLHSEDEDWDPSRRRRRRDKESDVANALMTLCESEVRHSDPQTLGDQSHQKVVKPLSKYPIDVVQKLRQAFSENELPSKDVKRKISEEVGLEYRKVNKWFRNARYMSLKNKKRERASKCSPEKFNSTADKATKVTVPKCSSMPTSTDKHKRLKKVRWKDNLAILISPSKMQKLKKASLGNAKVNVELSDDMSLKKHLLYLKSGKRLAKKVLQNSDQLQQIDPEKQMEHLCSIQAKLWKSKQILSTIEKVISNKTDSLRSTKEVVYVPFAELKESVTLIRC